MLRIDCLLLNTEVSRTVRQIIGYLGHKAIAEGKDAPFRGMYNELRKNGVEIDAETAAHIYADELPLHDSRFTAEKDLKYETGRWFDDIVRNITLQKPKRGEQQISELSPAQAVVKTIADTFSNNVKGDETTKSILKTLEDIYKSAGKRMLGELPNETKTKDNRSAAEIIEQALDNEKLGFRNLKDGGINGLAKMHDEVRRQIKELTAKMEQTGDHDKVEQWNNYAKSLEDAQYTMLLKSGEANKVLNQALSDGGFTKVTKQGKEVTDWQKLTGHINSYEQLRDNVVSSLEKQGFPKEVGQRVAESMSKEFRDIRGKILEAADKERQRVAESWGEASPNEKKSIKDIVQERFDKWQNYEKLKGAKASLEFSKSEAEHIVAQSIKASSEYGKEVPDGRQIDWQQLASKKPDEAATKAVISRFLQETEGLPKDVADKSAKAIADQYTDVLHEKIDEHSQATLDQRQNAIDRDPAIRKNELTKLAELHDLGIFNGAHDKLLAKVIGVEEGDRQTMEDIRQFAEQMSTLRQLMGGNEFLVPSMQRKIAHQIHEIVARHIENKTKALKVISTVNKIYQVENSSLVAGYRNLLENHLSGLIEYATTKANLRFKLGKELIGNKTDLRQLMADTWKSIAKGGTEFGLAPYQVGGNQLRVADEYNLNKMKDADWTKPKTWVKGTTSAILSMPRAFLSGTDGAFKTGMYRMHFLNGMYDAMMQTGQYTHNDAVSFLNDAIYGKGQLDKARIKAKQLYDDAGMAYVSKKEINIAANELLHENLLQGREVTPEMVQEVQRSAFHMAGLGMGHESNNPFSKIIQSSKLHFQRAEQEAFNKGKYNEAAKQRLLNTALNSVALRFAASQANWAWIKVEQSGLGLISSIYHYNMGKKISSHDLLQDPKLLLEQSEHYQKARQSAARGILGLAANAMLVGVILPAIAAQTNPDDEDPVAGMFKSMEGNYMAKALFLKLTPIWALADYYAHKSKSSLTTLNTVDEVMTNVTGFGDKHGNAMQFAEASKMIASPNKKTNEKGLAKLGQLLSNNIPHVPFYKPSKDALQTIDYLHTGKQPLYNYPDNFMQGLFGGGVMEDIISALPEDSKPEWAESWKKEE